MAFDIAFVMPASADRLERVERTVCSFARLLGASLLDCDLAFDADRDAVLGVLRVAASPDEGARRVAFWAAQVGGEACSLADAPWVERLAWSRRLGAALAKVLGVAPARLVPVSRAFFSALGLAADRTIASPTALPLLTVELEGEGGGHRFDPATGELFVPGAIAPVEGDELVVRVVLPGEPCPLELRARVRGSVVSAGTAGFALALRDLDEAASAALSRTVPAGDVAALPPADGPAPRAGPRARRALVIDDDALSRRMLRDALGERGFEVITADDGVAGLEALCEELLQLDVLVTDLLMPRLDGASLVGRIRGPGGESDLAIVIVTAAQPAQLSESAGLAGADAVLRKDLGADAIARVAEELVVRKRDRAAGRNA